MNFLAALDFICALFYIGAVVFILSKNFNARLNQSCALIFACFGLWALGKTITHNTAIPYEIMLPVQNILVIGAWGFGAFTFWFTFVVTGKKQLLKNPFTYVLMFIVPVVLLLVQWTTRGVIEYEMRWFGWGLNYRKNVWPVLLFTYLLSALFTYFILVFRLWRKTKQPMKRSQAKIIFFSGLLPLLIGIGTNIFLPFITNNKETPDLTQITSVFWALGIVYGSFRYKFSVISPATVVSNIFMTMADALIIVDPENAIIQVNPAAIKLLGYSPDEIEGQKIEKIFPDYFSSQPILEKDSRTLDYMIVTKDKKTIPVNISGALLLEKNNLVAGTIFLIRDISERKQAEILIKKLYDDLEIKVKERTAELSQAYESLKRTQAQLLHSEKLAGIGQLAAGVAHEINNPTSFILSNLEILYKYAENNSLIADLSETRQILQESLDGCQRIKNIVNNLIMFASASENEKKLDDLNECVDFSLKMLEHEIKYKGELFRQLAVNLPKIVFNKGQISQVIVNLLLNSIQAIKDRGQISVKTYIRENNVFIEVADTGSGITQENMARLFIPFFTTKEVGKGTGLGLYLARGIVQQHGGDIAVQSESGKGTTFTVRLPI